MKTYQMPTGTLKNWRKDIFKANWAFKEASQIG